MILIMGCTSAILTEAYVEHNREVKSFVTRQTSDLVQILQVANQVAETRIPATKDRAQALNEYMQSLTDAGLKSITKSITVASPTGKVLVSTNPGQIGKKLKLRERPVAKESSVTISAQLGEVDVDPYVAQSSYQVHFPIVQGDKVLGYAVVDMKMDQFDQLLRRGYMIRLAWILATMLAGMLAVIYVAFRFTLPIKKLVEGSQQVAQGNLYVSLPVAGTDEMGLLAQTFNQMVERLRENRQLQERLNEAEKLSLLGRFAATVAHEVRNSLNFINLTIDQIRAKHSGGDERAARDLQRNLNNIKDEIARQKRLVNDFLAAGRQSPPALAPCDLRQTLEQAMSLVEKQAHTQDISLALDLPSGMPTIQADAEQMKTCFLNILTNAIQAMPYGGRINVTARCVAENGRPGSLELRFADTGPGIRPQDREKVFNQFFSTKATGFGLGLAITKKIVEDHGGTIQVTDGDQPGTVIEVRLPLTQATQAQSEMNATPAVA